MIKLHVVTLVELYAHPTNTRVCDIFGNRFYFDGFSTVHTNTICMRFRFDPLSRTFSNGCVFHGNGQRISVAAMNAFSNENALLLTRPHPHLHSKPLVGRVVRKVNNAIHWLIFYILSGGWRNWFPQYLFAG